LSPKGRCRLYIERRRDRQHTERRGRDRKRRQTVLTSSPLPLERHPKNDGTLNESSVSFDERVAELELGEEVDRDELEGAGDTLEDPETEGDVEPDFEGGDV
jgi:hypothetical protein